MGVELAQESSSWNLILIVRELANFFLFMYL